MQESGRQFWDLAGRIEEACLPPSLRPDGGAGPAERRRARLLLAALVISPVLIALTWLANRAVGRPFGIVELVAEALLLAMPLMIVPLRRGVPVDRLSHVFIATIIAITFLPIVAFQGRALPATLLITTFPALAIVMVGLRGTVAWTGVVIVGFGGVALWAELRPDLALDLDLPDAVVERWRLVVPALLCLVFTVIVAVLEASRGRFVRELEASQGALAESESRFRAVVDAAPVGIGILSAHGKTMEANPRGKEMLGIVPGAPIDEQALFRCVHRGDEERAFEYFARALRGVDQPPLEFRWVRPGRNEEWVRATASVIRGADDAVRFVVGIADFITEQRHAAEQIRTFAYFDGVTGLGNRRHFLTRLGDAMTRAGRTRHPLAVLFLDLDGFKAVNDAHGHDMGDEVLVTVAERLASSIRLSSGLGRVPDEIHVSRYGGDEFTVLLAEVDGSRGAEIVARRLTAAIESPIEVRGRPIALGVSIGIAVYPDDGTSAEELVRRSDDAMYQAKRVDGSAFCFSEIATVASEDANPDPRERRSS